MPHPTPPARPHVLIIVQNLPVPLDRRVWQECRALVAADYRVSVICPKGPGDHAYEHLDGVDLHKYDPPASGTTHLGFATESAISLAQAARLALRIHARRPIDAIQACNPPDTYFLIGRLFRSKGVKFVFDHHDLCPEIFETRFGRRHGPAMAVLRALERLTFTTADHVIATNASYRQAAIWRGGRRSDEVTIVRSGPDPAVMKAGPARPALRHGRRHLCCYLGVMGPQDGVDVVIRAAHHLVHVQGRRDCHFALLGFGDCYDDLRRLTTELDLDGWVTFTGRADQDMIRDHLSSASVGLSPDPPSPFNDRSTMNKTLEYMAFSLPVVAFDLPETRVSAGDAAVYVGETDPAAFAAAIGELLDDPLRREMLGTIGRLRIEDELGWPHQAAAYVSVYDRLLRATSTADEGVPATDVPAEPLASLR